ncbi:MAG TPA: lipoprotein-releasing ABC transporter permease subunit [Chromatiaceae bacterium]|jgi:lipoprotein-releasing system permease protein|nr:lipoprotein-releasing ABC transporter permease subunit [Chromatiaceae bacterium]HIB83729.1 lipoprotein-releasing ABC transporter permease subunit [Chromatiaceae bacterium]
MFKPLELFVGLRYTRAGQRTHFISFISLVSVLGIALGVTALITVLSVMNGFENELRSRILGAASHATIAGVNGRLPQWQQLALEAASHPRVLGAAPYVDGQVMLVNGDQVSGTLIRGILPDQEPKVSQLGASMLTGSLRDLTDRGYGIILGSELARAIGVYPGDKVTVITPQAAATPAGVVPRLKRFTVVGLFEIGMFEFDRSLALMHINDASRLMNLYGDVSGVRLKVDDVFVAPVVARELSARMQGGHQITDWTRHHSNFFRAIQTEKRVMFIILVLIVAVAAFNIVSTLVMVVIEKRADIAILRTLGATPMAIMRIFVVQGTVIGIAGTVLGLVGGVSLALNVETLVPWIEQLFGVQFLAADVYYISDLPSDVEWSDVVKIGLVSFSLSVLGTLYPAWRASRTLPVEALRYE